MTVAVRVARAAEAAGFESVWTRDKHHPVPVDDIVRNIERVGETVDRVLA